MFQGLSPDQLEPALEALLFVTDEPVSALRLAEMLQVDVKTANDALDALSARLREENRGVQLREVAGGWRLGTHPAFHDLLEQYVISWDTRKLSAAALETLAIVAYAQPITRAGVAAVRGVNSDSSINSLVDKGLLREAGVQDAPGNPVLYATSALFLERFGLKSPADLPPLDDYAPDEETRALIRERLSARRVSDAEFGAVPSSGADAPQQDSFDDLVFEIEEETGAGEPTRISMTAGELMSKALASASGAVEKIDFSQLHFEGDDE